MVQAVLRFSLVVLERLGALLERLVRRVINPPITLEGKSGQGTTSSVQQRKQLFRGAKRDTTLVEDRAVLPITTPTTLRVQGYSLRPHCSSQLKAGLNSQHGGQLIVR